MKEENERLLNKEEDNLDLDLDLTDEELNFKKLIYQLGSSINDKYENDNFYRQIYYYYYYKGFTPMLLIYITDILSLIFGILFSIFIFVLLDWDKLLKCGNNNCENISEYVVFNEMNFFEIFLLTTSILYLSYKLYDFIPKVKNLINIRNYYNDSLKINCKTLHTYSWIDILKKVTKNTYYDEHDITNKILRKENYMISLIDKNIINISSKFYTYQLDKNLELILSNNLNNLTNLKLKKKLIFYGIINLLCSGFILIFQVVYFFISNIDDFYSNRNVFGPRRYTIFAKRKFREYNELPHFFEERINKSMKYSIEYTKQFDSPVIEVISKFIGIITGAFIGFFLILSILDESILLYVRFFDRTMLFYMGIISAISSFSRSYIKNPEESVYNPNGVMERVVKYTHYMPFEWKNKCHTYEVRDDFLSFFQYKIITFIYDIISVVTTPYILLFVLTKKTDNIISFIKTHTTYDMNVGYICSFATKNKNINDEKMKKSLSVFSENHSISLE